MLSAIFLNYKQVSFYGIFDRAEGFITITCYIILFIYSIYTFKTTNDYKYIITPIFILVGINAFLGLFQYIGQDLIKSNLSTSIVVPSEYQTPNSGLNLLFEKGKLYGTLYHYNYVGSFVAIVLPILFCLTIFEDEDIMHKIFLGIASILSIWLLLGITSRVGILGISIATILGVFIFGKFESDSNRADGLLLNINKQPIFMFNLKKDNNIHLINLNSKKDMNIVFPETFEFKGKEKLGSMRAYI